MKFRRVITALLALAMASSFAHAERSTAAVPTPPMFLGMATQYMDDVYAEFASQTGEYPAMHQVFWKLDDPWTQVNFDWHSDVMEARGMAYYAEIHTDNLNTLVSGGQDAELEALVSMVAAGLASRPGLRLLVAPLPEMNLPEHPWGFDAVGFKSAYLRIWNAFRDSGLGPDKVRFVFAVNGPGANGHPYSLYYPGDDYVDIVGFSKLNRDAPWQDYQGAFGDFIDEIRSDLTRIKPIIATQTGSVTESGDRDAWLNDMFTNLQAHDQVIGAMYFNRDKFEAGKQNDYLIATETWVDPVVIDRYPDWSPPSEFEWVFDGRMDDWIALRAEEVGFDDISGLVFEEDILWLVEQGITAGCATYRFCPNDPLTRAQMATFLVRAFDYPLVEGNRFIDVAGTHVANINALAAAGITLGCNADGTLFCPGDVVGRGQMASFMARAMSLPPSDTDWFVDDNSSSHEPNINSVADAAITLGCTPTQYCPSAQVTRGQMAAFLHRALG